MEDLIQGPVMTAVASTRGVRRAGQVVERLGKVTYPQAPRNDTAQVSRPSRWLVPVPHPADHGPTDASDRSLTGTDKAKSVSGHLGPGWLLRAPSTVACAQKGDQAVGGWAGDLTFTTPKERGPRLLPPRKARSTTTSGPSCHMSPSTTRLLAAIFPFRGGPWIATKRRR
jgi:hypothetical protein